MICKRLFVISLAAMLFAATGCDTGPPRERDGSRGIVTPPPRPGVRSCILLGIQGNVANLCPGDNVTLVGFNFPDDLSDLRVTFTAGDASVGALPLEVRNRRIDITSPTIESELDVLVPAGVSQGIIELFCDGISAGAAGFDSCPVIYSATLGVNSDFTFLFYFPNLGFQQGGSRVTVFGLNLSDVQEVLLDDGRGNTARVPASSFIRNLAGGNVPGQIPTGYESFGFDLNGNGNNVQFPFTLERENLGLRVRSPNGVSNRVEVPISTDAAVVRLGAVINAMRAPTGVSTGPVRIDYKSYEIISDASWQMEFEWCVEGCENEANWFSAKPKDDDPINDGKFGITCGSLAEGLTGGGEPRRLLPGGGNLKTFVWDAQCDPNFRAINDEIVDGINAPRAWTVNFRCRPLPEVGQRTFIDHVWQAPPFLYFDVEDREAQSGELFRQGRIVESFDDDTNEEFVLTGGARWGPPDNPGFLEGEIETTDLFQFGEGEAVVIFREIPTDDLPDQDQILGQFYLINTDTGRITHNVLRDIALPGDPATIVTDSSNYILTDNGDLDGNRVDNPGADIDEFHFAHFEIDEGVLCLVEGTNPLVMRIAGIGDEPSETENSVRIAGILDANGGPGGEGQLLAGGGGRGFGGGGDGGNGAFIEVQNVSFDSQLRTFIGADRGGNDGGHPGATPAAVDPDGGATTSRVAGSGGGGGGHRTGGGTAILGATTGAPSEFEPPRPGAGGPARGDFTQIDLTTGAGGGGGGASLSMVTTQTGIFFVGTGGGGGGAGGGTIKITARGGVEITPTGSIQCNGGAGGDGSVPPRDQQGFPPNGTERGAPGGGGSGGTIVVQSTGPVLTSDCSSLQVNGGAGGEGGASGRQLGGTGAPGFIRIESAVGGTPVCSALLASSTLRSTLRSGTRGTEINLDDATDFPSSGIVQIEDEVIGYGSKVGDDLFELRRALFGTEEDNHSSGARVVYHGPILPRDDPDVLLEGGLIEAPDELDFGLGRDGILQLTFIQSIDPDTGDALLDEDTGQPISVWTVDTDLGTITAPTGEVTLRARHRDSRPGFLDLLSLVIQEGVVLRGVGSHPLDISVRDRAEIAGTIDVSGFNGGMLRLTQSGEVPLHGRGGAPGPGGGRGGDGGTIEFFDGDFRNKDPGNLNSIAGDDGGLPQRLVVLNSINRNGQLGFDPVDVPTGGGSLNEQSCDQNCVTTAGGGGGGGSRVDGADGGAFSAEPGIDAADLAGDGGTAIEIDEFRFGGDFLLFGGVGGAGGGGSPQVSAAYRDSAIVGDFPFRGAALFAPGTGGGGGGGILRLAAANLHLRRGARLLARGGNAFQSIDLGGNGGGGGGGNILVQIANTFTLEDGVQIDVSAGKANRLPFLRASGRLAYEGNQREVGPGQEPAEPEDSTTIASFGGRGGAAGNGRIRLESAFGSGLVAGGVNSSVSTGPLLRDVVASRGISTIFRAGVAGGRSAGSHALEFGSPVVRFNAFQQPAGTSVVVLWEGAAESRDIHGRPGVLTGGVRDPKQLESREFVRFQVHFLSNFVNRQTQSIQSVTLPMTLPSGACLPFGF